MLNVQALPNWLLERDVLLNSTLNTESDDIGNSIFVKNIGWALAFDLPYYS